MICELGLTGRNGATKCPAECPKMRAKADEAEKQAEFDRRHASLQRTLLDHPNYITDYADQRFVVAAVNVKVAARQAYEDAIISSSLAGCAFEEQKNEV